MGGLSLGAIVSLGTTLLGFVSKLWGGGSKAATAGDQKALDEQAAVKGSVTMNEAQAQPTGPAVTKKALDDGKF